ncbi:multidrug effflux MFS transporter [uncultured Alsobacter sp.]|uniref:multidrug effflux MFS transporter n=1 Tax=uncultured Alsobacter sp. TaxID=1748258 RepID=UPI0025F3F967|nr:multidrug effflux MFS transporter [uncultured Alsobacter sp.]
MSATPTPPPAHAPMGFAEFVAMTAALMALNALAVDIMLPALPEIGRVLGVAHDNDRQVVIGAYMWGFGLGQVFIGTISDRYGRKTVLVIGIAVYVLTALIAASAPTFSLLLLARFVQGLVSAVPRVITTSIVRDCYSGRRMASVVSLAMTIFMAVPILAPSIGQVIMLGASWRAIFGFLAVYGVALALWVFLRLPETMKPEQRRALDPRSIAHSFAAVLRQRQTVGYATAGGLMFGATFSFLLSSQQILAELFGLGTMFPLAFAALALAMSASSFVNSRLVGRLGMRRIVHSAVIAYVALAVTLGILARLGVAQAAVALPVMACMVFVVGLVFGNVNALAMEPQGAQAGTASSLIGSYTTLLASTLAYFVGQAFDGTIVPLTTGQALMGIACLLVMALTDKGRLFRT